MQNQCEFLFFSSQAHIEDSFLLQILATSARDFFFFLY